MMNDPYVKSVIAQTTLDLTPPLIRETLLKESDFWKEYSLKTDVTLSFFDIGTQFHLASLYNAVRSVLSGALEKKVANTKGQKWRIKNIGKKGELPHLSLSRGEKHFFLPDLAALSPDRDTRLRFLDEATSDFNLPISASEPWRKILSERALEDDEVDRCLSEFRDTPIGKIRAIQSQLRSGEIKRSSLVPPSRRYFERLVGVYDESPSIRDYAASVGRKLFAHLSAWHPYDGFLFSLLLSSQASLTDEINVDQLSNEDLVRAYDFLENHGDIISQLGAIEVGLRVLPSRPEIEPTLIRLTEQIRDDDIDGQTSGFKLLRALFCLVDGQLSKIRLLAEEPPFYRRLAALSQAALIHRQLVRSPVDIDQFSEWAFSNREGFYLQSLADMRLEPRWDPNFAIIFHPNIRDHFFARILSAAEKYEANITGSPIYDLVLKDSPESLQPFGKSLQTWIPGPLEGTGDPQRILPSEFTEAIETQLRLEDVGPLSFPALVNATLAFPIEAKHAVKSYF